MPVEFINPAELSQGTYSHVAAVTGGSRTLYVSGQVAMDATGQVVGKTFAEQLEEAGVQIGWPTRLASFGPDVSATVFSMGFATRAAMSFGGIKPGEYRKILIYNKDRIFAFVLPLGYVSDEWYANAAGAINWGFPVIADTPIPAGERVKVIAVEGSFLTVSKV